MLKKIECGIGGKEFGFDYLSEIKETADSLGLVGKIFEKDDGSIKLIAEGEEKNLMEFAEYLSKLGSFNHPIQNFYVKWEEPTGEYEDFSISNVK